MGRLSFYLNGPNVITSVLKKAEEGGRRSQEDVTIETGQGEIITLLALKMEWGTMSQGIQAASVITEKGK